MHTVPSCYGSISRLLELELFRTNSLSKETRLVKRSDSNPLCQLTEHGYILAQSEAQVCNLSSLLTHLDKGGYEVIALAYQCINRPQLNGLRKLLSPPQTDSTAVIDWTRPVSTIAFQRANGLRCLEQHVTKAFLCQGVVPRDENVAASAIQLSFECLLEHGVYRLEAQNS